MDFKVIIPIGMKLDAWTQDGRLIEAAGFKGIPEGTKAKLWALDQQGPGGHMLARIVGEVDGITLGEPNDDGEVEVAAEATIMGDDFGIRIANLIERELLLGVSADLGDDYVVTYVDEYDAENDRWEFKIRFIESSLAGFTFVDKPAFPDANVKLAEPLPEEFKFGTLASALDEPCEDCDPVAPCESCAAFEADLDRLLASASTITQFVRVNETYTPPEIIQYPDEGFEKPELRRLTPFQHEPSTGRLFGHLAGFRTCHGAMPECVTPPRSSTGYRYFANVPVMTKKGNRVWVGRLVCDTVHAKVRGINAEQAMAHYANTGAVFGLVAIGEDEHGIWISGYAAPTLDKERLTVALACPPSGDWRPWPGIYGKELIAGLAVPVPGFNTPQAEFSGEGPQTGLIISNVQIDKPGAEGALTPEVFDRLDKIASFVERQMEREQREHERMLAEDRQRRVRELAASFA
jgi:hypothetical protein